MNEFLTITKALSDESRVRCLLSLQQGELCLCQLIEVVNLAPATVSKHMQILWQAGLVERRKKGRWHFFRLAGNDAKPMARQAIRWTLESLAELPINIELFQQICCVREKDLDELAGCYKR